MTQALSLPASRTDVDGDSLSPVVWLYLIALVLPVQFNIGPLTMMPTRLLLLIVIVPLSVNLLSGKYGRLLAVDILFFLHMVWAALAIGVNNPEQVIQYAGSTIVEFLGGYLVGRAYIRSPEQLQKLTVGLLLLNVALLPFSMVELKTGTAVIPKLIEAVPGLRSVGQITYEKRMGMERVQNAFSHPIHYGLFCSMAFSLVLIGLKGRMTDGMRWLGAVAIFAGVFMGLSSGPLLATFLQIGILLWAWLFRNNRRKWLLLVGLFALLYVGIDLTSNRTPSKVIMSYATFSAQTAYFRALINDYGWQNVWANPVFGLGLREWVRPDFMHTSSVDNFWLVMAMRYGLPGLVFVAAGYLLGMWQIGRRDFSADPRADRLRLTWVITFACLSFTLVTVHVWTAIYTFVFFMFGAGMWMIDWQPQSGTPSAVAPDGPRRRGLSYSRSTPEPMAAAPARTASPATAEPRSSRPAPAYTRFAPQTAPGSAPPGPRRP